MTSTAVISNNGRSAVPRGTRSRAYQARGFGALPQFQINRPCWPIFARATRSDPSAGSEQLNSISAGDPLLL